MGQVGSAGAVPPGESDGSGVGQRKEFEDLTVSSDVEVSVSMSDDDADADVLQPALLLPQATIPLTLPTVGDTLQLPAHTHPQSLDSWSGVRPCVCHLRTCCLEPAGRTSALHCLFSVIRSRTLNGAEMCDTVVLQQSDPSQPQQTPARRASLSRPPSSLRRARLQPKPRILRRIALVPLPRPPAHRPGCPRGQRNRGQCRNTFRTHSRGSLCGSRYSFRRCGLCHNNPRRHQFQRRPAALSNRCSIRLSARRRRHHGPHRSDCRNPAPCISAARIAGHRRGCG